MKTVETTSRIRTQVRNVFGLASTTSVPVIVIDGNLPPKKLGTSGGHFTRGGRRIHHPGAYARFGWSNMVYHCSDRRIYVGAGWLAAQNIK